MKSKINIAYILNDIEYESTIVSMQSVLENNKNNDIAKVNTWKLNSSSENSSCQITNYNAKEYYELATEYNANDIYYTKT